MSETVVRATDEDLICTLIERIGASFPLTIAGHDVEDYDDLAVTDVSINSSVERNASAIHFKLDDGRTIRVAFQVMHRAPRGHALRSGVKWTP